MTSLYGSTRWIGEQLLRRASCVLLSTAMTALTAGGRSTRTCFFEILRGGELLNYLASLFCRKNVQKNASGSRRCRVNSVFSGWPLACRATLWSRRNSPKRKRQGYGVPYVGGAAMPAGYLDAVRKRSANGAGWPRHTPMKPPGQDVGEDRSWMPKFDARTAVWKFRSWACLDECAERELLRAWIWQAYQ